MIFKWLRIFACIVTFICIFFAKLTDFVWVPLLILLKPFIANALRSQHMCHDDVIKWKHFRVTGPACGEFTGHWWIPCTKPSGAELCCFLGSRLNIRLSKQRWAGDLIRHRVHYDVTVMPFTCFLFFNHTIWSVTQVCVQCTMNTTTYFYDSTNQHSSVCTITIQLHYPTYQNINKMRVCYPSAIIL